MTVRTSLGLVAIASTVIVAPHDEVVRAQATAAANVVSMWGGARHCIILKSDGTVWDWGYNASGKLGDNTTSTSTDPSNDRHTPIQVHGPGNVGFLTGVIAVMGGELHNFALRSDGTVWAWGNNSIAMQLGDGTATDRYTPVQVSGLSSIVSLGGRGYHSLAVKSDGSIWAWGLNTSGQLGDGTITTPSTPVKVVGLTGPSAVTGGGFFSLALMPAGTLYSWGANEHGQLGDGTSPTARSTPLQIPNLTNVAQASAGWKHAVAVKSDGTVWTWGQNSEGELGNGTTTDSSVPVKVQSLSGFFTAVSAGDCHTAALRNDGTIWTWGCNDENNLGLGGQLGNGTFGGFSVTPVKVLNITTAVAIAARDYHNLALLSDGSVWSWGFNANGQLGDNTTTDRNLPVQVQGFASSSALHSSIDVPSTGSIVRNPVHLGGWALDAGASTGTGVDAVAVWARSASGNLHFLGDATVGLPRIDVGNTYGHQFDLSGFSFDDDGTVGGGAFDLPSGSYTFQLYPHSTLTGIFTAGASVSLTISAPPPAISIDVPAVNASVTSPFVVQGWAVDPAASKTTGVNAVHVYAIPSPGGTPIFLGAATYGLARPDVGTIFGSNFTNSGFSLFVPTLAAGSYQLTAFARSTVTASFFNNNLSVPITMVAPTSSPTGFIDVPSAGATLNQPFTVAGWAIDRGVTIGTGVDVVHVWAFNALGAATFVGQAAYGAQRTDVAALYGANFKNSGFSVTAPNLPPGPYDLKLYVRSTVSGAFTLDGVVHVNVQ